MSNKVVLLTGSELRHDYFRKKINADSEIDDVLTVCESSDHSLENRVFNNSESSTLLIEHANARMQFEKDYFKIPTGLLTETKSPLFIEKGKINSQEIVDKILSYNADLIVCYGSSLIRSKLLTAYKGRFLNVHLGLSPYYRGSGTNVWPIINGEPHMIGATFMHIGRGIDDGQIIHQIQADMILGDGPHSIGNRLIIKMVKTYQDIIKKFKILEYEPQPETKGILYRRADFDNRACENLYNKFSSGKMNDWVLSTQKPETPYLVRNKGLEIS